MDYNEKLIDRLGLKKQAFRYFSFSIFLLSALKLVIRRMCITHTMFESTLTLTMDSIWIGSLKNDLIEISARFVSTNNFL